MKYLVNRETKEHRIFSTWDEAMAPGCRGLWHVVQADPEGWIKHDGGECPLPDGCEYEALLRGGKIATTVFFWGKSRVIVDDASDVIAYRPILDDKAKSDAEGDTPKVKAEYRPYAMTSEEINAWTAQAESGNSPQASTLGWFIGSPAEGIIDRLKSAHKAANDLPDIIAELRDTLGPELMEMLWQAEDQARYKGDHGWCGDEPEPDMTDWRNWQVGDLVEFISREDDGFGELYGVEVGDIRPIVSVNGRGVAVNYEGSQGRDGCYRFHSRPTTQEARS